MIAHSLNYDLIWKSFLTYQKHTQRPIHSKMMILTMIIIIKVIICEILCSLKNPSKQPNEVWHKMISREKVITQIQFIVTNGLTNKKMRYQ